MSIEDFARLIHPLNTNTFFQEYWERQPLHIPRNNPNYYSSLFSLENVDDIICFTQPKYPGIQFSKEGESVPWNFLSESGNMDNINKLYSLYSQGNTLILRGLQHRCKPTANLYRSLESYFNHRVHINLYLTPQNSQGFAAHFDTHEVFILQIEGSKYWRIYDTFEDLSLPIDQQPLPKDKLQNPLQEIHLKAGELLYIPSGYAHEALTSESSSVHLTIGINVYRWIDLLSTAITLVGEQNTNLRKSLPISFLADDENREEIERSFPKLLPLVINNVNIKDSVERLSKNVFDDFPPLPDGHFAEIDRLNSINLSTVVKKRHDGLCRIFSESESISIYFPGGKVKGPKYLESSLHFIANTLEFSVGSLPNSLTDDSKLILVRNLIKNGLLTCVKETCLIKA
jgi:ribosomal protein L16 Arg81 hydroxylase